MYSFYYLLSGFWKNSITKKKSHFLKKKKKKNSFYFYLNTNKHVLLANDEQFTTLGRVNTEL